MFSCNLLSDVKFLFCSFTLFCSMLCFVLIEVEKLMKNMLVQYMFNFSIGSVWSMLCVMGWSLFVFGSWVLFSFSLIGWIGCFWKRNWFRLKKEWKWCCWFCLEWEVLSMWLCFAIYMNRIWYSFWWFRIDIDSIRIS